LPPDQEDCCRPALSRPEARPAIRAETPPAIAPEAPPEITANRLAPEAAVRTRLSFRAVNRPSASDHEPGLQRHHLLPFQLVTAPCLERLITAVGRGRVGFDDFRRNGLLLPATDETALLLGLPLHRGPHRNYNAMVMERVGTIEARWSRARLSDHEAALDEALFRLELLQTALRRRLLTPHGSALILNRRDPALGPASFSDLDAMAELLWSDAAVADADAADRAA